DPFHLPGLVYGYAGNSPTNLVDPNGLKRKPTARLVAMGTTPSKSSSTGKQVIATMKKKNWIKGTGKNMQVKVQIKKGGARVWKPLDKKIHMGHIKDAVTEWNKGLWKTGAKSPAVRKFMKDATNYELEWGPLNSSNGAKLGQSYHKPQGWRKAWPPK